MLFLGQILLFLLTMAGIAASSLAMIYFAGRAMNRAQTVERRRLAGLLSVLSLCGIVASAAAGFFGVGALLYFAQR